MTRSNFYNDLYRLAARYADRPDVVQGAGGNISGKVDADIMLIKASGREFAEVDKEGGGLVPVFYTKLARYLMDDTASNAAESAHVSAALSCVESGAGNNRPSMEVWFHTLLRTFVLHTHSAYANTLACSEEGSAIFGELMQESGLSHCVVPYCSPGFELGAAILKRMDGFARVPSVFLLENHGIIVTADLAEECADMHNGVERAIRQRLGIEGEVFDMGDLSAGEAADFGSLALFPDQIIYPEHRAIRAAHRFILKHIRKSGLTVRAIAGERAQAVAHMESEKHRKSLRATR